MFLNYAINLTGHEPSKPRTWSWWRGNTDRSSSERHPADDDVITSAYVGSAGLDLHDASSSFLTDVWSLPARWRSRSSTAIISWADSLFTEPSDLSSAAAAARRTQQTVYRRFFEKSLSRKDVTRNGAVTMTPLRQTSPSPRTRSLDQLTAAVVVDAALFVVTWWPAVDQHRHLRCADAAVVEVAREVEDAVAFWPLDGGRELVQRPTAVAARE